MLLFPVSSPVPSKMAAATTFLPVTFQNVNTTIRSNSMMELLARERDSVNLADLAMRFCDWRSTFMCFIVWNLALLLWPETYEFDCALCVWQGTQEGKTFATRVPARLCLGRDH